MDMFIYFPSILSLKYPPEALLSAILLANRLYAAPIASFVIDADPLAVLRELLVERRMPRKEAVKQVAKEFGLARSDVYRASLQVGRAEGEKGPA